MRELEACRSTTSTSAAVTCDSVSFSPVIEDMPSPFRTNWMTGVWR
jgi:hypothetical protein